MTGGSTGSRGSCWGSGRPAVILHRASLRAATAGPQGVCPWHHVPLVHNPAARWQRQGDRTGAHMSWHGLSWSHVPSDQMVVDFVFIRYAAHWGPCILPMTGLFASWRPGTRPSWSTSGKPDYISLNRLKSAHLGLDLTVRLAQSPWQDLPGCTQAQTQGVCSHFRGRSSLSGFASFCEFWGDICGGHHWDN